MASQATLTLRPSRSDRFLLRISHSRTIDGLWVGTLAEDASLDRVAEALAIIKQHDPRRHARLRRDLKRIWVRAVPGGLACYTAALDCCELDSRFVADEANATEMIASAIVHEATHARLARCAISYEERDRARIEGVCIRRELAFAARLPDGAALRERIEAGAVQEPEAFTDAAFEQRLLQGQVEVLHHAGVPRWLVRLILALRALRLRFQAWRSRSRSSSG